MLANKQESELVEVLSEEESGSGHIPAAINMSLDKLQSLARHFKKN